MDFVRSVVTILKEVFNVKSSESLDDLRAMAAIAQPKCAVMRKVIIKENDNDKAEEAGEDDDKIIEDLAAYLSGVPGNKDFKPQAVDFEKDDDNNGHIGFMHATSNLRARNYTIGEIDFQKVKFIAGKIIPAIATTTAMIVGGVGNELVKYTMKKNIELVKNSFHNLALPFFVFSETIPPTKNKDVDYDPIMMCAVKATPPNWTSWDSLDITGPLTLQGLIDNMKEVYKLSVSMIILGTQTVWMSGSKRMNER